MSSPTYRPVQPGIARTIVDADTCSLKRLAWAYGCSPKGSHEEDKLGQVLIERISAELVELGATWAAIASEYIVESEQLRAQNEDLEIRLYDLNKAPAGGVGP